MKLKRVCNCCHKKYEHNLDDKQATNMKDYSKYLGYCCMKCYSDAYINDNHNTNIKSLLAYFNELELKKKYK